MDHFKGKDDQHIYRPEAVTKEMKVVEMQEYILDNRKNTAEYVTGILVFYMVYIR